MLQIETWRAQQSKSKLCLKDKNNNLLLTEREGRTGEYWPEVVAVPRGPYKTTRANIPR